MNYDEVIMEENIGRCLFCNEEMEHDMRGSSPMYIWHMDCVALNQKEW